MSKSVECINNTGFTKYLTKGKVYTVLACEVVGFYEIVDDTGNRRGYCSSWFIDVE